MKKTILFALVFLVTNHLPANGQVATSQVEKKSAPNAEQKAEQLVRQWFNRLNALDDWFITMEGKEEPEEVVKRMVDLYHPEIVQFVTPSEDQIGTVTLSGLEAIRVWADRFARSYVQLAYRISVQTVQEKTVSLVYVTEPPWGGLAASVEFIGVYSLRESRRRFMVPGTAFFQFVDGKIWRMRLYIAKDEMAEIVP
ncbi:MAG: nuclear transport factor 2 family protein [Acidobacteria bacterium]|nr:nuclear transport factor 2 family protein [Acidobacteriota bacterium]